jgi:hypothetical protein
MSSGFGSNGMQGRCYSLWQDYSEVRPLLSSPAASSDLPMPFREFPRV